MLLPLPLPPSTLGMRCLVGAKQLVRHSTNPWYHSPNFPGRAILPTISPVPFSSFSERVIMFWVGTKKDDLRHRVGDDL